MFIRSQDKRKLIDAGQYAIAASKYRSGENKGKYGISAGVIHLLGIYSTEERAIEVLSWIMEAIENEENTFQMPQELETVFTGTEGKSRWKE